MVILQQRFHCIFHSDPVAIHVLFNYSTYKTVINSKTVYYTCTCFPKRYSVQYNKKIYLKKRLLDINFVVDLIPAFKCYRKWFRFDSSL